MIRELQIKHSEWASRNFPNAVPEDALIGIIEEVGELAHAHLKAKQGIRGTPEQHRLDKMDAIGDIVMYLLHYSTLEKMDIPKEYIKNRKLEYCSNADDTLLSLSAEIGKLSDYHLEGKHEPEIDNKGFRRYTIINIMRHIDAYCKLENFDRDQILQETWTEISQRDWLKNKENGVTE